MLLEYEKWRLSNESRHFCWVVTDEKYDKPMRKRRIFSIIKGISFIFVPINKNDIT
jgi:hypothetical protein